MAFGQIELRQLDAPKVQLEVAHVGDAPSILHRRSAVALELLPHLLTRHNVVALVHHEALAAELLVGQVHPH